MRFRSLARAALAALAALAAAPPVFAVDLLVVDNPAAPRPDGLHVAVSGVAANDHVALSKFAADPWPGGYRARPGDNVSLLDARGAVGVGRRGFAVDYLYRAEGLLVASGDTAHGHVLAQTDRLFDGPRRLDIDYRLQAFEADGVRLGARIDAPGAGPGETTWGVAVSALRVRRLKIDAASGRYVTDGNTASLNGTREQWSSELQATDSGGLSAFLPFAPKDVPATGSGYGVDLGVVHRFGGGARVEAAFSDLWGRLRWRGIPHMSQRFEINNVSQTSYESSGAPAVGGFHNYVDFELRLDLRRKFAASLPLPGDFELRAQSTRIRGQSFPQVAIHRRAGDALGYGADYDVRFASIGVGVYGRVASIWLRADRLSPERARVLGMSAAVSYAF